MSLPQNHSASIRKTSSPGSFPDQLRRERERHGWSQKELAGLLDTSQVAISRWEKGRTVPGPYYRRALAELFGVSVQELGLVPEKTSEVVEEQPKDDLKTDAMWKIPVSFTPFIGREQELTRICDLLKRPDVRLLTLLGPPGVGKTRLSIRTAEEMRSEFKDGACFISLATINDLGLVLPTIAKGLGIRENGTLPLAEHIIVTLHDKHFLLLLDNLEQIVAAHHFEKDLAPLLEELLEACPDLKILVTSRVVLYLQAEHIVQIHPLNLPGPKIFPELEKLGQVDAVRLFVQRAQAIQSDFQMTHDNAHSIAEICTHLDGLPLAIELAAARIRLLPPQALLTRLKHHPQVLHLLSEAGPFPRKKQTLYQTIKWSYDLLDTSEQWLFRHLSVFSNGCTLEAVEFYVTQSQMQTVDVLNTLSYLIDKSLLSQTMQNGEPRFTMLEVVREYGLECLQQQGELEKANQLHASFYASLVIAAGPHLSGSKQIEYLQRLNHDMENLRIALRWLIEHEETETALQFADAFGKFYGLCGYWTEELIWLQSVLKLPHTSNFQKMRARVLRRAGHLAYRLRNLEMARDYQEESATLSQAMDDKQNLAGALSGLAWTRYRLNDTDSVAALLSESVAVARASGDKWVLANALESQGRYLLIQDDTDAALALVTQSVQLAREVNDKESLARLLTTLISVEMARGNSAHARTLAEESFTIASELNTTPLMALILEHRGNIALFLGEYQQAADTFEQRLALARELDDKPAVAKNHLLLAEIALRQGDFRRATKLAQDAATFFRKQGDNPNIALSLNILGAISLAQNMLTEANQLYQEALKVDKESNKRNIGKHLVGLALVTLAQQLPESATLLFGAALSKIKPEVDMHPEQRIASNNAIKSLNIQLGERHFQELLHKGATLKINEVFELLQSDRGMNNRPE